MIVLDETEYKATVVLLKKWQKKDRRNGMPGPGGHLLRARDYFEGLTFNNDGHLVLDLLYRKKVDKTELFRLLPEQLENKLKVKENMVNALQMLAQAPLPEKKLPEEIEDLRVAKDATPKVGLVVQTLLGSLVSVFILVFA